MFVVSIVLNQSRRIRNKEGIVFSNHVIFKVSFNDNQLHKVLEGLEDDLMTLVTKFGIIYYPENFNNQASTTGRK